MSGGVSRRTIATRKPLWSLKHQQGGLGTGRADKAPELRRAAHKIMLTLKLNMVSINMVSINMVYVHRATRGTLHPGQKK